MSLRVNSAGFNSPSSIASADARRAVLPHPKLQAIHDRGAILIGLALERVIANAADPRAFPLPADTNSLERLLKRRFDALPPDRRASLSKKLSAHALTNLHDRRESLGELAAIDLRSNTSVLDQAKDIPLPANFQLSSNDLGSIAGTLRNRWTGDLRPSAVPDAGAKATRLQMRFNAAKCVETTHGEPGKDEISLAGVAVDNLGAVSAIGPLPLGQFADGQLTVVLDGQPLRTYDLTGGNFPKAFALLPVLDRDRSGRLRPVSRALGLEQ